MPQDQMGRGLELRMVPAIRPENQEWRRHISVRQRVILRRLAQDWTDHRTARSLEISDRQVRREIETLCRLFGATGRIQLVGKALMTGAIPWTMFVS
ncbi:hypothetical protein AB0I28_24100 [Phytomonospora sp. NPDC050363]|uniref:hypothetical protein n=1 Tax=Phytomonospora sp. NPDC050363 TaxID=3155642 RepID=UPI0033D5C7F3